MQRLPSTGRYNAGNRCWTISFIFSPRTEVDASLVVGSLLFGIGWGIGGYCPGLGIALFAVPDNPETVIFLGGFAVALLADSTCSGEIQAFC